MKSYRRMRLAYLANDCIGNTFPEYIIITHQLRIRIAFVDFTINQARSIYFDRLHVTHVAFVFEEER